jgi:hypothetical protein
MDEGATLSADLHEEFITRLFTEIDIDDNNNNGNDDDE